MNLFRKKKHSESTEHNPKPNTLPFESTKPDYNPTFPKITSEPIEEWTIKDYEQWGERNASKTISPNESVDDGQKVIDYKEWYEKNKFTANPKRQMRPFEPFTYKREDKNIHTSDGIRFCSTCGQKFSNHEEYLRHNFQTHGCSDL